VRTLRHGSGRAKKKYPFSASGRDGKNGHAIRGGVPLRHNSEASKAPQAPAQGFARTKNWRNESTVQVNGEFTLSMFTESDEHAKK